MKHTKRLLAFVLALVLLLGLFACAQEDPQPFDPIPAGFELDAFLAEAQQEHSPEEAFRLITTGMLTFDGQIPDEAIVAYVTLLHRVAEDFSGVHGAMIRAPMFVFELDETTRITTLRTDYNFLRSVFDGRLSNTACDFMITMMTTEPYREDAWESFAGRHPHFARLLHEAGHPITHDPA